MKLKIKNIGIVEQADIEIKSISVITGTNNSGKSTIGKVLFSLATVQNMASDDTILLNRYKSILNELNGISRWIDSNNYRDLYLKTKDLVRDIEREKGKEAGAFSSNYEFLESEFKEENLYSKLDEKINQLIDIVNRLVDEIPNNKNLNISISNLRQRIIKSEEDKSIKILTLEEILSNEFSGNFISENKSGADSLIELTEDNGDKVNFYIENRIIDFEKSIFEISRDYSEAVYFDDPFLLDDPFARAMLFNKPNTHLYGYKHRRNTLDQINKASRMANYYDKSIQSDNIQNIFSKILEGEVKRGNGGYFYHNPNFSSEIGFDSLSAGMKSFSIIQMMIEYGLLNNAEYLILDEPETHLHPEWQVKFAELVVLISLHYPIRILVTSHSPYFVEALDIYSRKYNIDNDVKFYHSYSDSSLGQSKIVDVSDNLEEIFESMYRPLNYLEELRDDIE